MIINDEIVRTGRMGSPLISFNENQKNIILNAEFRKYKDADSHEDIIEKVATYGIGENLIDFISIPDIDLKKIREAAKSKPFTEHYIDTVKDLGSLYLFLIYESAHMYTLENQYVSKLEYISQEASFALKFCCSTDYDPNLNKLSNLQRYYLYCYLYPDNMHTNTWLEPSRRMILEPNQIIDTVKNLSQLPRSSNRSDNSKEFAPITKKCDIPDSVIESVLHLNVVQTNYYECGSIEEYLKIEFLKMIELGIRVKKCKNCGKYFILKGDYNTDYCDRILEGKKVTCKKIAAIKARKEKIDSDQILREYEKAYKRNYAKRSNHKISEIDFFLWVEESTKKRDEAALQYKESSNIEIVQEFKKYLGNK